VIASLVIGGNGFLGAPLVSGLAANGHDVTSFDRYSAGLPAGSNGVRHIEGDFMSRRALKDALAGQQRVFHFLSTTTPVDAENRPAFDLSTNVAQTVELLELCIDAGVERFYFASSGGTVYGAGDQATFAETDATQPISPYGIGKLAIENYLGYFRAKFGLETYALRISNPYGAGQNPDRRQGLIPIVLARVRDRQPVTRIGDGSMVRDYIFLDDLIEMILALDRSNPRSDTYNLGSGVGHSVAEVLALIEKITGETLTIHEIPRPATFLSRIVLDTDRFVSEFGDRNGTTLEAGVRQLWQSL
jgi:UDP-glucose 4-epimerase